MGFYYEDGNNEGDEGDEGEGEGGGGDGADEAGEWASEGEDLECYSDSDGYPEAGMADAEALEEAISSATGV